MFKTLYACWIAIFLIFTFIGCEAKTDKPAESPNTSAPAASTVPLRLWIVGQVSEPSLVERAWLTGSDQKLEIRVLRVDEYLAEKSCNCDVAIFPSRLLGELIDRKWLTKLPASLSVSDENAPQIPAAWTRQATFGGEVWAVSLGSGIPVAVVSPSAADAVSKVSDWDSLLTSLAVEAPKSTGLKIDPEQVDRAALVDRFFAIAGILTQRSPDYGLLFDLQKMTPRLTEPEFQRAAEILVSLSQQTSAPELAIQSVIGDSSQAWKWINAQSKPALAFVSPGLIDAKTSKETGCKAIRVPAQALGWNTGGGLIASLSSSCRQSARATELLRWLRQSDTRHSLSQLIVGVESASPISGSDSSAWQATSIAAEQAANGSMPSELRLPRAEEYRLALAGSLIAILSGAKPADALGEASAAWQAITTARGREMQRTDYERSLGLSRN